MSRIFSTFLLLLWALWFGGTILLFIFVKSLFNRDRSLAITAAPILFLTFERYQLILGTFTLIASGLWMITAGQGRIKTFMLICLMAASAAAVVSSIWITPRIMEMRRQNLTQSDEFKRAHAQSGIVYTSEAILLFIAGLLLASAMHHQSRQRQADAPQA